MLDLIEMLQKAKRGGVELDARIACQQNNWPVPRGTPNWTMLGQAQGARRWTESLDLALELLPCSAVNHHLFSFGGHGRNEVKGLCWGFKFHDTARLVGEEAAKQEVRRLLVGTSIDSIPHVVLERAIAEQYREFSSTHAASPALAVCLAAARHRADISDPTA